MSWMYAVEICSNELSLIQRECDINLENIVINYLRLSIVEDYWLEEEILRGLFETFTRTCIYIFVG